MLGLSDPRRAFNRLNDPQGQMGLSIAPGRPFGIAKGASSTTGQQSAGSLLDTEEHPRPSKHHDVLVV
jgi:hypothetical protein